MRKPLSKAFTLVELLVVIAVIVVLISMLLPALNRARESANQVACQSNMRQLGIAFGMYINEFKKYPSFRWPEALNPYLKGSLHGTPQIPELGTNINLDRVAPLNLIHCPSVGDIGKGGQKLTLTYTMNGVNTNFNFWKMLCIAGQATDGLLPNVAPARVRRPAEFGLLTEKWKTDGPEQCCWTTTWWRLFVANDFTCLFVHARGTRSNVLFADLHVEPLRCKPTGIDANTRYPLVNDQNDALFNYDYGALRNGGAGKPSKYLN